MTRGVPLPLRTWSGALLVCALLLCLSGLARPAMAMTMPGPMEEMGASASVAGHAFGQMPVEAAGHATEPMVTDAAGRGPHCPMTQQQCEAPKAAVVQDGSAGSVPVDLPRGLPCNPAAEVSQLNAPPPALPPPDLHRLCVSRT
ncbi:hypothetical protein ABZW18_31345 [Streptomyces sp. NPDC004647]|uniref:hypothetical protein n=1 Tax=Streptomyces sp. NPDC004647 TaxID=3154671 RepID=UPI0033B03169